MRGYLKLMRGRNSGMHGNTVACGRLLPTRLASCGARLRRSITSGGEATTTDPETTAGALPVRLNPCGASAACWNTRQKPALGRHTGWPHLRALAGNGASMAGGYARFGKAHTGIGLRRRRGCTTADKNHRCNCDGIARTERIRLDSTTSAARRQTSRHSANAKRTQRPSSSGTRLSHWHDKRRECLL